MKLIMNHFANLDKSTRYVVLQNCFGFLSKMTQNKKIYHMKKEK